MAAPPRPMAPTAATVMADLRVVRSMDAFLTGSGTGPWSAGRPQISREPAESSLRPLASAQVAGYLVNAARKRAREAREELGLGLVSPVADVLRSVEAAGVAVAILDLGPGLAGAYLHPQGTPVAFVNGRDAAHRQRFTLAHEFGHHRLGHGQVVDEPPALSDYDWDPNEVQANYFAAEFLMPKAAALAWAGEHADERLSLETVVRYAAAFGVSAKAACISLERAGVLGSPRLARRLHDEIEQKLHVVVAAHLGLPELDDEIAAARGRLPRLPLALRHSAVGDLLAGTCGVDELARRLGRDVADVRAALDAVGLAPLVSALR
jgi:Zn-dependent peptidase ImmA (M78 family)